MAVYIIYVVYESVNYLFQSDMVNEISELITYTSSFRKFFLLVVGGGGVWGWGCGGQWGCNNNNMAAAWNFFLAFDLMAITYES
jgi:hypothetical protein